MRASESWLEQSFAGGAEKAAIKVRRTVGTESSFHLFSTTVSSSEIQAEDPNDFRWFGTSACYDHADRLTSTIAAGYCGSIVYDGHWNTTTIAGETWTYDSADRRFGTTKTGSPAVAYVRDATGRIVSRSEGGTVTRFCHGGGSDSPSLVLDSFNTVLDKTFMLPGGVMCNVRGGTRKWSYPNLHGDLVATADTTGAKQGATISYDPYGNGTAGKGRGGPIQYAYISTGVTILANTSDFFGMARPAIIAFMRAKVRGCRALGQIPTLRARKRLQSVFC